MDRLVKKNDGKIKVLVIEDNTIVHKAVAMQLELSTVWKFELFSVYNMTDALIEMKDNFFDIVLSDLELPDSNRKSTLNILKNEFTEVPFIILTSTDDDQLLLQSIKAGARNYLCKDYLQQGSLLSRTLFNAIQYWKMEKELKYIASHDDLTGAMNKRCFIIELNKAINSAEITDYPFCLAICDLDNFRVINNKYGHIAGDRALKLFVESIKARIRNCDIIARFGGDEFCILFPETKREKCERYLNKLSSLKIDITVEGKSKESILVKGSYGGSQYKKGMSAEELMIEADKALYQVKENGKGFCKVL